MRVTVPRQKRDHYVFQNRHPVEGPDDLKGTADPHQAPGVYLEARDIFPVYKKVSMVWGKNPGDEVENRRFPRSIGSDEPNDFFLLDLKT